MKREYYADSIENFLATPSETVLGRLVQANEFTLEQTQRDAWQEETTILQSALKPYHGTLYFEYSIPRMGKRIDAVVLLGPAIFILEFKVGERGYLSSAMDQVSDYALDLKNFHETSHDAYIVPILITTDAENTAFTVVETAHKDKIIFPIACNTEMLPDVLKSVLLFVDGPDIDPMDWEQGRYHPTPTIVEAAMALYSGHSVEDISRSDASAINLGQTFDAISQIVEDSRQRFQKAICFVTGVPGAGKTLVGLNIATKHIDKETELYSVFLSGNGPLVAILREALARDRVQQERAKGHRLRKSDALRDVKMFIQNVHNFRDECLIDMDKPPLEHVALFDEAQRAWDLEQTASFMHRKKKRANFNQSEPQFLISCLNRHPDWAVIVCLVGGGQEINTGEAGIGEWIDSLNRAHPDWHVYISSRLTDSEYRANDILRGATALRNVITRDELHLAVSMRSFRAENVSLLVKQLLDLEQHQACETLAQIGPRYPIVITRDLRRAKQWLKSQARGSERYGIVVSSQAVRLKPHAIDVRAPVDPVHWFLDGKDDVRSSYYLEDVVTEFQVQGLELDWACVTWDGDFRYSGNRWEHWSFVGSGWNRIRSERRQIYLKNAYRVLLTRARQGMVIVVPQGSPEDPTRKSEFYDPTFEYLQRIGFPVL